MTQRRFELSVGAYQSVSLNKEDVPWKGNIQFPWNRPPLLLGWRCAASVSPNRVDDAKELIVSTKTDKTWLALGHAVNVSACAQDGNEFPALGMILVVDLWTYMARANASAIEEATNALERVRHELNIHLHVQDNSDRSLKPIQEFLKIKIPRFLGRNLDTVQARANIVSRRTTKSWDDEILSTLSLAVNRLQFGPEPEGCIAAVERYLRDETSDKARAARLGPAAARSAPWVPILMAAALLGTWSLPLRPWSVALASFVFTCLMILAIIPARQIGFRNLYRRTATIASTGLFAIAVFGLAYALRGLLASGELKNVESLGDPFLISTGLGVAGGILDDYPKGYARIIAHLQLLLFLSGLIGVVAIILRIDRGVRRDRE